MRLTKASLKHLAVVIIALALQLLLITPVRACMDPSSAYAVEVVLNKPGVRYNLSLLESIANGTVLRVGGSTYMFKYTIYYEQHYTYPSRASIEKHEFLIVIYEAVFSNGAPYAEGISNSSNIEHYLGVRVELAVPPGAEVYIPRAETITITTTINLGNSGRVVEVVTIQTTAPTTSPLEGSQASNQVVVYPDEFKNVLKKVLSYLTCETGVVLGLSCDDIESIVNVAEPGLAGWNSRLIYSASLGAWAPYFELVNSGIVEGVLLRGNACAVRAPTSVVTAIELLKPLLNTTIIMVCPGPAPPTSTLTSIELVEKCTTPMVEPTTTYEAHYLKQAVSTPSPSTYAQASIAGEERALEKPQDGAFAAISVAVGVLMAVLAYLYLSKHLLS
jgi:hypothetical protein